jgi:hypothetical protein
MSWLLSPLTGCADGCSQTGESATDLAPVPIAFPREKTNVNSSSSRWARMGGDCSQRSRQIPKATGCCLCLRLIRDSGFGNKTTCHRRREEPGLPRRIGWRQHDCSLRPLTLMRKMRRNDQPIGLDTKCISPQTCAEDGPHLITHVATAIGPIPDREALPTLHEALDQQELLPEQHLVDAGYVDAELLVASQTDSRVDLVGPTGKDHRGPTREQTGYALRDCSLDWEHEQARCPQGHSSSSWTPTKTRGQEVIKVQFAYTTCGAWEVAISVYALEAKNIDPPTTRSLRSTRSRPSARTDRGICSALCRASRDRRHPCGSAFVAWDYAARALWESRARICTRGRPRLPAICAAYMTG